MSKKNKTLLEAVVNKHGVEDEREKYEVKNLENTSIPAVASKTTEFKNPKKQNSSSSKSNRVTNFFDASQNKKVINRPPEGWSEEDLAYLYSAREDGVEYYLIAASLKRSVKDIQKVFRTYNWETSSFYDKNKLRVKESVKTQMITKILDASEKKRVQENSLFEALSDRLERAVKAYDSVPELYSPSKQPAGKNKPEDICLLLSDMHIGDHYTMEETNGLGEYNLNIFKKRLNNLKKTGTEIMELHSKLYETPNLHLMCLGDMVHGMNDTGAWSQAYIEIPVMDQWIEGCSAISELIYYWLGKFQTIYFYGIIGNHARMSEKGVERDYVNWDYLMYKHIELKFKDNPRVVFNVPKSWYLMTEIKKHNFLLIHGDEISGGNTPLNKIHEYEKNMTGVIGKIPNYTVAGHFHNPSEMTTNNGKVIINGSWPGTDIYSLRSLQKGSRPVQKIFGIHEKIGITWTYDINLDFDKS